MQPFTLMDERGTETHPAQDISRAPFYDFHLGDSAEVLRTLRPSSVHTIVTSPPYFALRDYHRPGQIGQEACVDDYVRRLVAVFRQAKRVLRDDGTLWLNIGDSFAGCRWNSQSAGTGGIKKKELIGVPWLVAFALRADGWFLRCDVIWHKSNGTPESVRDRPGRCHEYLFLLSKTPHYFYDKEAVREPNEGKPPAGRKAARLMDRAKMRGMYSANRATTGKWAESVEAHAGFAAYNPRGRNQRSVWKMPASCFHPAKVGVNDVDHFAMMPPELVRPCILAGTSAAGCCAACGAPLRRIVHDYADLTRASDTWEPTCFCPDGAAAGQIVPCTVLDPFGGSGTSAAVAKEVGRSAAIIDLNADYLRLARARVSAAVATVANVCAP